MELIVNLVVLLAFLGSSAVCLKVVTVTRRHDYVVSRHSKVDEQFDSNEDFSAMFLAAVPVIGVIVAAYHLIHVQWDSQERRSVKAISRARHAEHIATLDAAADEIRRRRMDELERLTRGDLEV